MLIIFGLRRRGHRLANVFALCGVCHSPAAQGIVRIKTFFTLFFIPLIPLGSKYRSVCTMCGATSNLTKEQADHAMRDSASSSPSRSHGPGRAWPDRPQSAGAAAVPGPVEGANPPAGEAAGRRWEPAPGPQGTTAGRHRRSGPLDRQHLPLLGHALQGVPPPVGEGDARAHHQVAHGPGDEDLTRPGHARVTRAAMCTARPPMSSPRTSTSPACRPARSSRPAPGAASTMAAAQRTAWVGAAKRASTPSPVVLTRAPSWRSSSRRTFMSNSSRTPRHWLSPSGGGPRRRVHDVGEEDDGQQAGRRRARCGHR